MQLGRFFGALLTGSDAFLRVSLIVGPDLDDADANGDVDTDCGRAFGAHCSPIWFG
jgi:hypothetical protein